MEVVCLVLPVPPECPDHLECPVNEVLTAIVDLKVHPDRPDYPDRPAPEANKDQPDHVEHLERPDFLELLANRTRKEICVKSALQCCEINWVNWSAD